MHSLLRCIAYRFIRVERIDVKWHRRKLKPRGLKSIARQTIIVYPPIVAKSSLNARRRDARARARVYARRSRLKCQSERATTTERTFECGTSESGVTAFVHCSRDESCHGLAAIRRIRDTIRFRSAKHSRYDVLGLTRNTAEIRIILARDAPDILTMLRGPSGCLRRERIL